MIVVEKVPPFTCEKCGGTRVFAGDKGPECQECDRPLPAVIELTDKIEEVIQLLNCEEIESNEAF